MRPPRDPDGIRSRGCITGEREALKIQEEETCSSYKKTLQKRKLHCDESYNMGSSWCKRYINAWLSQFHIVPHSTPCRSQKSIVHPEAWERNEENNAANWWLTKWLHAFNKFQCSQSAHSFFLDLFSIYSQCWAEKQYFEPTANEPWGSIHWIPQDVFWIPVICCPFKVGIYENPAHFQIHADWDAHHS